MKNMNSFYQEISTVFMKYVIGNISNSLEFVLDPYSCHYSVFEVSFLTIKISVKSLTKGFEHSPGECTLYNSDIWDQ